MPWFGFSSSSSSHTTKKLQRQRIKQKKFKNDDALPEIHMKTSFQNALWDSWDIRIFFCEGLEGYMLLFCCSKNDLKNEIWIELTV